jgi:hypothetical protein
MAQDHLAPVTWRRPGQWVLARAIGGCSTTAQQLYAPRSTAVGLRTLLGHLLAQLLETDAFRVRDLLGKRIGVGSGGR